MAYKTLHDLASILLWLGSFSFYSLLCFHWPPVFRIHLACFHLKFFVLPVSSLWDTPIPDICSINSLSSSFAQMSPSQWELTLTILLKNVTCTLPAPDPLYSTLLLVFILLFFWLIVYSIYYFYFLLPISLL